MSQVVTEVTEAMLTLEDQMIRFPTPENCLEVARNFYKIAEMPGVIGCVDGKFTKNCTDILQSHA